MTAVELLATLQARHVRVKVRGGRLHVQAPQGALDTRLRAALSAQRDELVDLLTIDANGLLTATFDRIAAFWIEGAELPPAELEEEIDRATVDGDIGAIRAALSVYEQAAWESCRALAVPEAGGRRG